MSLIRKIILIASLVFLLIVTDNQHSWAISISVERPVIMNLFGKSKAAAKDVEGKTQENLGKITGNNKAQVEGKAKQVESKAGEAANNVQELVENVGRNIENLADNIKANVS
jgi:uncharacterized protein YjbJ (UPF0337 family)